VNEGSGILWGWKEIALYARVCEDKARALANETPLPLPVHRDGKGLVQSTKSAIDLWANQRALAKLEEIMEQCATSQEE
jgi:hypothetical protein